jgi:uncharacterized membrane protein (DUF373 family)
MENIIFDKFLKYIEYFILFVIVGFLLISSGLLIYDEIALLFQHRSNLTAIKIIIELISKTLLLLMIIEILSTVKISITQHILSCQPFLVIGMIAAVRRLLVISVEIAYVHDMFYYYIIEMGILISLVLIFVFSLTLLRKNNIT